MRKKYRKLQDYVMDTHFRQWVLECDPEAEAYWQAYLSANPEKAEVVKQARSMVLDLGKKGEERLTESEKSQLWERIQASKGSTVTTESYRLAEHEENVSSSWWRPALRVAASIAAIMLLSITVFNIAVRRQGKVVQFATQYGEVKNITLPDGSSVVLNANSVLSFAEDWNGSSSREVTLSGEAFFNVTHQKNNQEFKVKLSDGVVVEVLGTKFTATQRPHKTRVVLKEGKVKFSVEESAMLGLSATTVAQETLQPGELVELTRLPSRLLKERTQHPDVFTAFQQNKLMFVDAPLTEVALVLKDTYGYDVTFADAYQGTRRYTGTVPYDRVDLLFTALEKLFKLKIKQQGKQLEFT